MSFPENDVQFRPLGPRDEGDVLKLLTLTMAGGPTGVRSPDFFRWKHVENPFGRSPGMVAVSRGRIVGVRLFLRWLLEHGDERHYAVRAVDTATHPDFARRGIFTRLTLDLLDRLERTERVDLVFNTPNSASRPGYLRMGWTEVGVMPVHVSPVRPIAFLRGMGRASRANASGDASRMIGGSPPQLRSCSLPSAAEVLADNEAIDRLIVARRRDFRVRTPLNLPFLRWRYADPPGLDYRAVVVTTHGRMTGLGLGRVRARAGLTEFTLSEVLVGEGDKVSAARVLRAARRSGADHVAVHAPRDSEAAAVLGRSGYLRVPGNGIRLIANVRSQRLSSDTSIDAWGLSLGDLEVF